MAKAAANHHDDKMAKSQKPSKIVDVTLPKVECTSLVNGLSSKNSPNHSAKDQRKVKADDDRKSCSIKSKTTTRQHKSEARDDNIEKPRVHGQKSMAKYRPMPEKGQFCFAKIRGYVEWPSVISLIEGRIAVVMFFGANSNEKL